MALGLDLCRLEVALHRLRGLAPPGLGEGELHGLVAVALHRLDLGDRAGARLDDRDRNDPRVLGEDLRHPELRPQDPSCLGHGTLVPARA